LAAITALLACAVAVAIVGCGGGSSADGSVAPDGAPYSYEVPDGFEAAAPGFPGEDPKFLSTLVLEGTSHEGGISAFQWTLGAAERQYSTAKLLDWLNHETRAFYRGEGATLNHGIRTEVGGREAICWMIRGFENFAEGRVDADACVIVGRHNVVQQACMWKPAMRDEIERGCAELRATLKVS
jgi:hypothetical protein